MSSASPTGVAGRPCLTGRETEIITLIAAGHSNALIANHLFLTEKSVKNYLTRIYAKLGAASRSDAVSRWQADPGLTTAGQAAHR
jgi:DNA-binding CsgD family transcriptional regulator